MSELKVLSAEIEAGEYKGTAKGQTCHRRLIGLITKTSEGRMMLCIEKSNAQDLCDQLRKILRRMI